MTEQRRQWRFWIIAAVVAAVLVYLLRDILLPFVAGMAIAYLLDPLADRLERRLSRGVAAGLIVVGFCAIVALALVILLPVLQHQLTDFIGRLPEYFDLAEDKLLPAARRLLALAGVSTDAEDVKAALGSHVEQGLKLLGSVITGLFGGGMIILNLVSLLVITPVVAFYLLRDWDVLTAMVDNWLPRDHAQTIREQAREADAVLSAFVRGQSLVCISLAVFYAVALSLVGLQFGLVIGLLTGIFTFIPYVGATLGLVASLSVALVQFWPDGLQIGVILGIYVIGQVLEGYVFIPYMIGDKIGLHPVWVIFGLMAGAALFGFVGVLIALPVFAVLGVLTRFGLRRYLESSFYRGNTPTEP